jgi:hypothetical protein
MPKLLRQMDWAFDEISKDEATPFGGRVEHDLDEVHVDEVTGEYRLSTGASLEPHWLDRLVVPPDVCSGCFSKEHCTLDCPALHDGVRIFLSLTGMEYNYPAEITLNKQKCMKICILLPGIN